MYRLGASLIGWVITHLVPKRGNGGAISLLEMHTLFLINSSFCCARHLFI